MGFQMIFQMYLTKESLMALNDNNFIISFDELVLSKHYFHWGLSYPYRLLLNVESIVKDYEITTYDEYHDYTKGDNTLDLKGIALGVCLNTKTEKIPLNNMTYIESDIMRECGVISRASTDIKESEVIKIKGKMKNEF